MARDAKKPVDDEKTRRAFTLFGEAVASVERAKEALVAAAPGRRGPGVQLAEALWGFETGIEEARGHMAGWRTAETEAVWRSCLSALDQSARSAEELRLGAPPDGYEELYARLAELLEPLEAFGEA
ncbi:MAG TPA: hypothetical protein VHH54_03395, partial [Actinomycetota bacterium]|nr:hypothetical protein [Actinomycetota bacterium]